jgi:hypothetical protein
MEREREEREEREKRERDLMTAAGGAYAHDCMLAHPGQKDDSQDTQALHRTGQPRRQGDRRAEQDRMFNANVCSD